MMSLHSLQESSLLVAEVSTLKFSFSVCLFLCETGTLFDTCDGPIIPSISQILILCNEVLDSWLHFI